MFLARKGDVTAVNGISAHKVEDFVVLFCRRTESSTSGRYVVE